MRYDTSRTQAMLDGRSCALDVFAKNLARARPDEKPKHFEKEYVLKKYYYMYM